MVMGQLARAMAPTYKTGLDMLHHRHRQCFCRRARKEAINPRPTRPRHRHRCSVTTNAASKEAVVIGAGIGGLVAACKLAQQGLKVTILEQNSEV
jgi:heterodisulfide reductase subunit A-like polyferredoxin